MAGSDKIAASTGGGTTAVAGMLRALRHRNYRLFFLGQGVSVIGTWMQGAALGWLVYAMTGSNLKLGVVTFASQIPSFLFAPLAGVLADRLNRHKLVIATQAFAMLQAAVLATLTLTGVIEIWHIIVLALLLGVNSSFDIPIRQVFVVDMLESREDLPNAIALNSFLVNGGRMIGPALAGIIMFVAAGQHMELPAERQGALDTGAIAPAALVAATGSPLAALPMAAVGVSTFAVDVASRGGRHTGEGACFAINAVSYLAVIWSLLAMRLTPLQVRVTALRHMLTELREGFKYACHDVPIRAILLLMMLVNLLGVYGVLLPGFTRHALQGDQRTYGFLMSVTGVGAVCGALFLAARRRVMGLKTVIAWACCTFGAGLALLSLTPLVSHSVMLAVPCMVIIGAGFMIHIASSNTLLQTLADEDKRGRIMGFYTISFMGMTPFGALMSGALAERLGTANVLLLSGLCCIAGGLYFASKVRRLRRLAHRAYIRKGLVRRRRRGGSSTQAMRPQ